MFALQYEVRAADVGRQHGLLDHLVCVVAGAWYDFFDTPALVADDLRLHRLEVNCTTPRARLQQGAVDVVQIEQIVHPVLAACRLRAVGVGQDGGHFGIGETRVAPHHRGKELVGADLATAGDKHVAHHAQTLDFRVQRTQAVGEFLRQHGYDAAREIHAGRTIVGIHVDGRAGIHIMADIGNCHQQAPALDGGLATAHGRRLTIHGVVEIARVLAVDRHQGHIRQVDALLLVLRTDLVRQRTRQRDTGVRELVWHAVLAHGDLDLHARVVDFPQYLLDPTDRLAKQCGRLYQLHHHHLPCLGGTGGAFGYQHVLAITLVFRRHQPDTTLLQQAANDRVFGPFDNLDYPPFGAALAVAAYYPHLDPVLVQHGAHFVGRQINVRLAIITGYKSMAIPMALDSAFHFVQQGAGLTNILDTIALFPEMPRWRNW